MSDDDGTVELSSDVEDSDSTDDDLEEELTWDSEDSRPAGPSPDSDPDYDAHLENPVNYFNPRRLRRRRVVVLPDSSLSENSSQVSTPGSLPAPSVIRAGPQRLSASESDSELSSESYGSATVNLYLDPSVYDFIMQRHDNNEPQGSSLEPRSLEYSPPRSPQNNPPDSLPPLEPVTAPGPLPPAAEPEVVEIPVAQHINPTEQPAAASKPAVEEAQLDSSVLSEGEDASLCTICMCPLTNSGTHRVVCLKCGHIFGQACVERWIKVGCNNGAKRCPTCNKRACIKDIRVLYLPKVVPLDTSERDRLMQEKEELAAQKKMLESDFTRTVLQHKLVLAKMEEKIASLEKQLQDGRPSEDMVAPLSQMGGMTVVTTTTISHDGGCRVMAFNTLRQDLVVSQPSGNTVFAGFGVRVLNSVDWQPSRFVLLHSKAVRDLQFHHEDRDLLLSVSLDQNAKLFDLSANTTVHTFKGEGPLWSCCWDVSHPHLLLLGSQTGKVIQYDRRMTDHSVNIWEMDNNKTPVVALASTPSRTSTPFPQGGFLSCRLNSVYSYARQGEKYACQELAIEGPFMSMRYDGATQTMLTTSRPSSRSPHTRVRVSLLDCDTSGQVCAPLIHMFNCGSSARVMSRSTTLPYMDDSLVVAHNESGRMLDIWSTKRGDHLHSIPVREPVIDLTSVPLCSNKPPLLAALSEKKLSLYRVSQ